jgi:hypothetical protein
MLLSTEMRPLSVASTLHLRLYDEFDLEEARKCLSTGSQVLPAGNILPER